MTVTRPPVRVEVNDALSSFLEVEATLQDRAGRTADYAEGVRAFLEKRPARFEGR